MKKFRYIKTNKKASPELRNAWYMLLLIGELDPNSLDDKYEDNIDDDYDDDTTTETCDVEPEDSNIDDTKDWANVIQGTKDLVIKVKTNDIFGVTNLVLNSTEQAERSEIYSNHGHLYSFATELEDDDFVKKCLRASANVNTKSYLQSIILGEDRSDDSIDDCQNNNDNNIKIATPTGFEMDISSMNNNDDINKAELPTEEQTSDNPPTGPTTRKKQRTNPK